MSWFEDLKKKLGPALDCRTPKPGLGGAGIWAAYDPPTRVLAFPPPPEDVEWRSFMARRSLSLWSASLWSATAWGTETIETVMLFSLKHDTKSNVAFAVGGRYEWYGGTRMLDRVGKPVIPRHYRTLEPTSKT